MSLRPSGLTLSYDQAALLAIANNPRIREVRARRGLARAQLVQSGILPNPEVALGMDFPTDGKTSAATAGNVVEVSWALSPLFARGKSTEAERENLDAVELDIAWQEWQVAQAARLGVVRLALLGRRLAIVRETTALVGRKVALLEAAMRLGNATATELYAARSARQDAALKMLQLVQEQRRARLDWLRTLGLPPSSEATIATNPKLPLCAYNEPQAISAIELGKNRLDLRGLRRALRAQDSRARAAALRGFPAVRVAVNRARDTSGLASVGFSLTFDLPVFDRNQGERKQASASYRQLESMLVSRTHDAQFEVARIYADIESVQEQLGETSAWIPILERLVASSEQLLETGDVSVFDVYDLQLKLLDTRLLVQRGEQNVQELGIALELASGVPRTGCS